MPSTETRETASTRDAPVPEERPPQREGLLPVLMIGIGGLLTVAWFCLLVLLGFWLIRAVL
jgi:hypothetical protein